jgi:hypothetical protein
MILGWTLSNEHCVFDIIIRENEMINAQLSMLNIQ